MGHTRWATHGVPSDNNSHPHLSNNGKIAIVHNGIIENYDTIKQCLSIKTTSSNLKLILKFWLILFNISWIKNQLGFFRSCKICFERSVWSICNFSYAS
jgi:predicted glutamine amidotransferase